MELKKLEETNLVEEITLIPLYLKNGMQHYNAAEYEFVVAQGHRSRSLEHYKNAGQQFLKIKQALQTASSTNQVVTSIGTFTSFENFIETYEPPAHFKKLKRRQIYDYIRLSENWDVLTLLKLDQPNACYRLDITLKIITWAKKKKEDEGIDIAELDHHLYFQENADRIQKNRELKNERERLVRSEFKELRVELDYYKSQFQEVKSKLDRILSTYPELADL